MRRRAQTARNSVDSSTTVRVRNSADLVVGTPEDAEWRDVFHFPYGEEGGLVDFCQGGGTAYLTSSLGRETTALLRVDLATGETLETLYSNDRCNVGGVTLDRDTKELQMISTNYARTVRVGGMSNLFLFLCILTLFASGFDAPPPPPWYFLIPSPPAANNFDFAGTRILRRGSREGLPVPQIYQPERRNRRRQPIPRRDEVDRHIFAC